MSIKKQNHWPMIQLQVWNKMICIHHKDLLCHATTPGCLNSDIWYINSNCPLRCSSCFSCHLFSTLSHSLFCFFFFCLCFIGMDKKWSTGTLKNSFCNILVESWKNTTSTWQSTGLDGIVNNTVQPGPPQYTTINQKHTICACRKTHGYATAFFRRLRTSS